LAVHLLCSPGTHQTVTIAAHHEDIPLGLSERGGEAKILIHTKEAQLPVVEVRSLLAYEAYELECVTPGVSAGTTVTAEHVGAVFGEAAHG
jgi:hypothetical protein